ncbi:protein kinase [Marinicella sp. W31]|uniref:protein kinase domain-containing protein n=1 Tax=Marinicella sp. W31 TaxID=3023713 RepID=UPI0037578C8F
MDNETTDQDQKKIDFALLDVLVERYPELDEKAILALYHEHLKNKSTATIELLTGKVTDQTQQLFDSAIMHSIPKEATSKASYRIDRRLDSGGQSDIFMAHRDDGTFEQTVVIKRLQHSISNAKDQQRMLQEMQILADLKHPNVVTIFDAGIDDLQHPWMILEYIDGVHIDQHVLQAQLSQAAVIKLCITVAEALQYIHQQSICHLDIKPSNILVETIDARVRPVIIDFGIADRPDHAERNVDDLMATPAYAAPEQLDLIQNQVDQRSDIYAFGQLLKKLLNCQKQDTMPAESMCLEADLQAIVDCCTHMQPDQRYPDMQVVLADLQCYISGLPVSVRPLNPWQRWHKRIKRQPVWYAGGFMLVMTIVSLMGYAIQQKLSANNKAEQLTAANQYYWQQADAIRSDASLLYALPTQNIEQPYSQLHHRYDLLMEELTAETERIDRFPLAKAAISLGRFEDAQMHLIAVTSDRKDDPEALVLLAKNHFNLYQMHVELIRQNTQPEVQRLRIQTLKKTWIEPAIDLLTRAQSQLPATDPVISSLLLYYSGQTQAALVPLAEVQEKRLWPIEQLLLSAQILQDEARKQLLNGDKNAAEISMHDSMALLDQAYTIARSDPSVLQQWCQAEGLSAWIDLSLAEQYRGGCENLRTLLPHVHEVINLSAHTTGIKARETLKQGQNPMSLIRQAKLIINTDEHVESGEKFHILGLLSSIEADWLTYSNDTGLQASLQAIAFYRKAADRQTGSYEIQLSLADALYAFANQNYNADENAEDFFTEAEGLYAALIEHPESDVFVHAKLVLVLTDHAYRRYQSSLKADNQLQRAERILKELLEQWPNNPNAYAASAYLYWTYAHYQFIQGYDPEPHFSKAVLYFQKDLSFNPDKWAKRYNFISLLLAGAAYELEQGREQQQALERIHAELMRLANQVSDSVYLDSHWGYFNNLQARQALIDKHSAKDYLLKARQYNLRTLESAIDRYAGLTQLATTLLLMIQAMPEEINPEDKVLLQQGLADYPDHHRLRAQYGHILVQLADRPDVDKARRSEWLAESLTQLERALSGNPLLQNRYASQVEQVQEYIKMMH